MSKARLIISAVVIEGRPQVEVAREYGVSKGWVSKLIARYKAEGESAFTPRSRRPHTTPGATPETVDLVLSLRKELAEAVLTTFRTAAARHGYPASTLTDNGMVYTVRLASRTGGRTALEAELRRLHIQQKNSRPGHPTTCGKVERFQQTMVQPATIAELQAQLETFAAHYNTRRPHRSLPHRATPAAAYQARPKASPTTQREDTHDRIRHDRIDTNGTVTLRLASRLRHIGIGRTHAGTHVILLIQDLNNNVRVINATTGELLRELTIDTNHAYQPTRRPPQSSGT